MQRRGFLHAMAASLPLLPLGRSLSAAVSCGPPTAPLGVQACQAGIVSDRLKFVFAPQQMSEWCWAACLEMVFAYYGYHVPQQEIVRQTWGGIVNMPAQPAQIVEDLNRPWVDIHGSPFAVQGDVFSASAVTAAQDLALDMPLIIGSMGHAMLFTALAYQRLPNGQGVPTLATVRDPYPYSTIPDPNQGKRFLSPREWIGEQLLVRIRVTPLQ